MARKINVKFNGKVIDTRRTDRTYTHAIVLTDFDPQVARRLAANSWGKWGSDSARNSHRHAVEAHRPDYRYASVVTADERTRYAAIAAMPVEEYIAKCHVESIQRTERDISWRISAGALVLSYHCRHDLALKAQAAAAKDHPAYKAVIVEIEGAATAAA